MSVEDATMVVLREELDVGVPVEEAFAFVGDFANAQVWDPGVETSRNATGSPVGVGTRYDLIVIFGDRRLPMTYEVTAFDPPRRVVLHGTGSTVTAVDDIRFEPTSSGTRIHYTADLRLRGVARIIEPLLIGRFRETGRQAMAGMTAAFASRSGQV
jgi:carbon monoxide dehydrogenase subunit G